MKTNTLIDYKFSNEGTEPVTLSEAKAYIKVPSTITSDDTLITSLIKAARRKIEKYMGLSLISRTVEMYADIQTCNLFSLLYGPIDEITSIVNSDGDEVSTDDYKLLGVTNRLIDFPYAGKITITFTTDGAADDEFKTFILRQVAWLYENRGDNPETRLQPALAAELSAKRGVLI